MRTTTGTTKAGHLSPADRALIREMWAADPAARLKEIRGAFRRRTGRTVGYSAVCRHRPEGCGRRHADLPPLRAMGLSGPLLMAAASLVRAANAFGDGPMRARHMAEALRVLQEVQEVR